MFLALLNFKGFFNWIADSFVYIGYWLLWVLIYGISMVITFVEYAFYLFAGINSVRYQRADGTNAFDSIINVFISNEKIANAYLWLCVIAFVVMIVLAILKIIKQDYIDKEGPRSKAPIFRNLAISFVLYISIPILFVILTSVSSILAISVYRAFGGGDELVADILIKQSFGWKNEGAYQLATNYRLHSLDSGQHLEPYHVFYGLHTTTFRDVSARHLFYSKYYTQKYKETAPDADYSGDTWPLEGGFNWETFATVLPQENQDGAPGGKFVTNYVSAKFSEGVEFYWYTYFVGAVMVVIALFDMALAMVKRLYRIVILYVVAPGSISQIVMDGGAKFKKWKDSTVTEFLRVVSSIMGFMVFVIIIGIVNTLDFKSLLSVSLGQAASVATAMNQAGALSISSGVSIQSLADASTSSGGEGGILGAFSYAFNAFVKVLLIIGGSMVVRESDAVITEFIAGSSNFRGIGTDDIKKGVTSVASNVVGAALAPAAIAARALAGEPKDNKNKKKEKEEAEALAKKKDDAADSPDSRTPDSGAKAEKTTSKSESDEGKENVQDAASSPDTDTTDTSDKAQESDDDKTGGEGGAGGAAAVSAPTSSETGEGTLRSGGADGEGVSEPEAQTQADGETPAADKEPSDEAQEPEVQAPVDGKEQESSDEAQEPETQADAAKEESKVKDSKEEKEVVRATPKEERKQTLSDKFTKAKRKIASRLDDLKRTRGGRALLATARGTKKLTKGVAKAALKIVGATGKLALNVATKPIKKLLSKSDLGRSVSGMFEKAGKGLRQKANLIGGARKEKARQKRIEKMAEAIRETDPRLRDKTLDKDTKADNRFNKKDVKMDRAIENFDEATADMKYEQGTFAYSKEDSKKVTEAGNSFAKKTDDVAENAKNDYDYTERNSKGEVVSNRGARSKEIEEAKEDAKKNLPFIEQKKLERYAEKEVEAKDNFLEKKAEYDKINKEINEKRNSKQNLNKDDLERLTKSKDAAANAYADFKQARKNTNTFIGRNDRSTAVNRPMSTDSGARNLANKIPKKDFNEKNYAKREIVPRMRDTEKIARADYKSDSADYDRRAGKLPNGKSASTRRLKELDIKDSNQRKKYVSSYNNEVKARKAYDESIKKYSATVAGAIAGGDYKQVNEAKKEMVESQNKYLDARKATDGIYNGEMNAQGAQKTQKSLDDKATEARNEMFSNVAKPITYVKGAFSPKEELNRQERLNQNVFEKNKEIRETREQVINELDQKKPRDLTAPLRDFLSSPNAKNLNQVERKKFADLSSTYEDQMRDYNSNRAKVQSSLQEVKADKWEDIGRVNESILRNSQTAKKSAESCLDSTKDINSIGDQLREMMEKAGYKNF